MCSPLSLPVELCEIIFNHLSARELLTCSLVSSTWNEFVARTKSFDKIALRISEGFSDEVEITRSYKYVRLVHADCDNFVDNLRDFCSTARRVDIINCRCMGRSAPVTLELLEELTLSRVPRSILLALMSFHERLRVLNVHHLSLKHDTQPMSDFLAMNENLKEINFYLNESCNIFARELDGLSFNLTSVSISFQSHFPADSKTLTNIENLLIDQGKTLKFVSLINAASVASIYRTWNFLPRLQRLHFFTSDRFMDHEPSHYSLGQKESLKSLEFHALGPFDLNFSQDLKPILSAARNLQFLGVWRLEKDLLEHVALNLMQIRRISCATMEENCEDLYEQLKAKKVLTNKNFTVHRYL